MDIVGTVVPEPELQLLKGVVLMRFDHHFVLDGVLWVRRGLSLPDLLHLRFRSLVPLLGRVHSLEVVDSLLLVLTV